MKAIIVKSMTSKHSQKRGTVACACDFTKQGFWFAVEAKEYT